MMETVIFFIYHLLKGSLKSFFIPIILYRWHNFVTNLHQTQVRIFAELISHKLSFEETVIQTNRFKQGF